MSDGPSNAERIWHVVSAVPRGHVVSYAQVAELAGLPRGARLVGRILSQLPAGSRLPWHRVVTASGRLAFAPGTHAFRRQRKALLDEGVIVTGGRVSMRRYQWVP